MCKLRAAIQVVGLAQSATARQNVTYQATH